MSTSTRAVELSWLESYKRENADLLRRNPEFARWLESGYRPIAGGWQY